MAQTIPVCDFNARAANRHRCSQARRSESVRWQAGLPASRKRNDGDRFLIAAVLPSLPKIGTLFLHRVVKLFMGVHHILMRLLNGIELRLLVRIEKRPDLRQRAVHHRFRFLHRLLMNGDDLRLGCIKDRLNLGLLIRCQIQLIREMAKAEGVTVRTPSSSRTRLCVHNDKSAKCDRTGGHNC